MLTEDHDGCDHRYASDLPPEELSRDRREFPFSIDWEPLFERSRTQSGKVLPRRRPPDTQAQALMESLPHHEPDTSKEETLLLREALIEAFSSLDDRQRWLFEAIHYRRISVRAAGREIGLSKTQTHRVYLRAVKRLREALEGWYGD